MRTVGQILKKARLEKKISLEQVEASTKIHWNYLFALEKNDFSRLPSLICSRGFIKNYAEFLELDPGPILAIFRRDAGSQEKKGILNHPLGENKIKWQPKLTLIVLIGIFFLGLVGYLLYQYFSLVRNPSLTIFSPKDKEEILTEKIEIFGKADPDSLVTINGNLVLSSQGEFKYQLELFPGENKIVVEVKSKLNKTTRLERTVFRLDN